MASTTLLAPNAPSRFAAPTPVAAPLSVTTLTPQDGAEWDAYVRTHPEGTFFHLPAWRDAVAATFDHVDLYLIARRGARIVGALPLFQVNSLLGGRMLVSVPYAVGGGILADDNAAARALFAAARDEAERRRCHVIDLRSARAALDDLPVVDRYVGFRRALPGSSEETATWLPRKARAAARNAREKHGLTVAFGDEHVDEVWNLYAANMRRLGSINYPVRFFHELIARTPGRHWVSVIRRGPRTVAGLVTFLFGDTVLPYFVGAGEEARACSAGQFVYLTVIERAVAEGYRWFDFGRSRRDNEGSYNFKRLCGFTPAPLGYQRWVRPGAAPRELSPGEGRFALARTVWSRVPLCVTRPLGAWLSRHLPG